MVFILAVVHEMPFSPHPYYIFISFDVLTQKVCAKIPPVFFDSFIKANGASTLTTLSEMFRIIHPNLFTSKLN